MRKYDKCSVLQLDVRLLQNYYRFERPVGRKYTLYIFAKCVRKHCFLFLIIDSRSDQRRLNDR